MDFWCRNENTQEESRARRAVKSLLFEIDNKNCGQVPSEFFFLLKIYTQTNKKSIVENLR